MSSSAQPRDHPLSPSQARSRRPSIEQLRWIQTRDALGETLDAYLRTRPTPEMRTVIADLEQGLRVGDHLSGLLP